MKNIQGLLKGEGTVAEKNLKIFGLMLVVYEGLILLFYGIFVRFRTGIMPDPTSYSTFLGCQMMLVIGFALFRTFGKGYAYSVLLYTLLINTVVLQVYILWIRFTTKVVVTGFNDGNDDNIYISTLDLASGCGCVFAVLIAFSAVLGRVGPKDLLIMSQFCLLGYCFNTVICQSKVKVFDPAGTSFIHVYGTFFGLTASWLLGRKVSPKRGPPTSETSIIFSTIGTLILWIYFPIFNSGVGATGGYQQYIIALNTFQALVASCISTFAFTALMGRKIMMEDILNATLSGGIAIGIVSSVSYSPINAVITGLVAGLVSTWGFHSLSPMLRERFGLYDACGILNLHGIPGILGGVISMIVVWTYNNDYDTIYALSFGPGSVWFATYDNFWGLGFRQIGAVFCSIGFGVLFGVVAGFVMLLFYDEDGGAFYDDGEYIMVGTKDGEPLLEA